MLEISRCPFAAGQRGDRHAAGDLGARVGDELLRAVDHPLAALEAGGGPGVAGVRAGLRLGQPEGGEPLAAHSSRQPFALLLVRPPEVDRHRPQRGVGRHRDADRGVHPGQLLDRQGVGEGVGAAAPVLLGEGDTHQPQLAHLGDDLVGEGLGPVELLRDRRDLGPGELPNRVAKQPLLVAQLEIHDQAAGPPRATGPSLAQVEGHLPDQASGELEDLVLRGRRSQFRCPGRLPEPRLP